MKDKKNKPQIKPNMTLIEVLTMFGELKNENNFELPFLKNLGQKKTGGMSPGTG